MAGWISCSFCIPAGEAPDDRRRDRSPIRRRFSRSLQVLPAASEDHPGVRRPGGRRRRLPLLPEQRREGRQGEGGQARPGHSCRRPSDEGRRSSRLPERPRHRDPAPDRHGQEPGGRRADERRVPGGSAGPPGGPPRPDRPAPVPGPAPPGRGAARQGRGGPPERPGRPRAVQGPDRRGLRPPAAARHAGRARQPVRGLAQERPGPGRGRPAQPDLQPDHGADHRDHRPPSRRPGEHRPGQRPDRDPRHRPAAADHGRLHDPLGLPSLGPEADPGRKEAERRGLGPGPEEQASHRLALRHRQPDRPGDRDRPDEGALPERDARPLPEPVRQRAPLGRHAREGGPRLDGGAPAEPAIDLRLRRQAGLHGGAPDRGDPADRRRPDRGQVRPPGQ